MSKERYRKAGGFSLVELLVAIVIIAILAGSVLLVFGPSGDRAAAVRIAEDLDALRSAVLAYAQAESWNENAFDAGGGLDAGMLRAASVSPYLDKSIDGFEVVTADVEPGRTGSRVLVGFTEHPGISGGVERELVELAASGVTLQELRDETGAPYDGGRSVYMSLR